MLYCFVSDTTLKEYQKTYHKYYVFNDQSYFRDKERDY